MILFELLLTFMKIGVLSFGGGFAVLPLIEEELVHTHQWLTMNEFIDILTLSEMTPGPIAINSATFAGNRVAGIAGGITATIGVTLPSFIIVIILAYLYFKYRNLELLQGVIEGLRPAVVALIGSAGATIFMTALFNSSSFNITMADFNPINFFLFILSLIGMRKFKVSPIQTIIITGILGAFIYTL